MALRICSYNIEWFDHLFEKDNSLKTGTEEKARLTAIGNVIKAIDPDLLGIVEAPNTSASGPESTVTKLEKFASSADLRIKKAMTGFISGGIQELALLYDPSKVTVTHSPGGKADPKNNPRFDGEYYHDTDEDQIKEIYKHYRPPLEAKVKIIQSGEEFKLMLAHTKSKGIFDSMDMVHLERENFRNCLKLYAECDWIRLRVDEWLGKDAKGRVIVMGDFNDGPGMDYYEGKYGRSAIEIVMGDIFAPDRVLHNLCGKPKWTSKGWEPASARFKERMTGDQVNVLIDHILCSASIKPSQDKAHNIWNPYENNIAKPYKDDLSKASDHFPVSLDLNL